MKKYVLIMVLIICVGCASKNEPPRFKEIDSEDMKALEYASIVEQKLYSQFVISTEHYKAQRLNEIADILKSTSSRPYWPTQVYVIDDSGYINACTGGRHVYIGQGLLNLLESDDERAYIIAHELAHVEYSHPMKTFESTQKVGIFRKVGGYATSIFFVFLPAGSVHPGVSLAAQSSIAMVNQAASDIIHKGYKRKFEIAADKKAVEMMRAHGYDPEGAMTVLAKLEKATEQSGGGVFADHPAYDHRIEDIKKIIGIVR